MVRDMELKLKRPGISGIIIALILLWLMMVIMSGWSAFSLLITVVLIMIIVQKYSKLFKLYKSEEIIVTIDDQGITFHHQNMYIPTPTIISVNNTIKSQMIASCVVIKYDMGILKEEKLMDEYNINLKEIFDYLNMIVLDYQANEV